MSQSSEAANLVATAERLQNAVRGASWVHVSWLVGWAVASFMYLTALGAIGYRDNRAVLVVSLAFGVCAVGLCVGLLPRAKVIRVGFGRRWTLAVAGWGVLYAVTMIVGLLVFRGELAFWLPMAVLSSVPLVLGARAEIRA